MPSFMTTAALAALSLVPAVYAHGHVQEVRAGGKTYKGGVPEWKYNTFDSVGWLAENQDNGFVSPSAYGTADIICHKNATPGNKYVEVEAGSELEIQWDTWPVSHHGPVLNYLARCNGDCTKISATKKEKLNWFAIQNEGLLDASNPSQSGWASDLIVENDFTAKVKIPTGIRGNFVLRHEIIGLHSANQEDGAQNYPQCINIKVTGSGNSHPCKEGAECRKGTELFKSSEEGVNFNLYGTGITSYPIPGMKVYAGLKKRFAQAFRA